MEINLGEFIRRAGGVKSTSGLSKSDRVLFEKSPGRPFFSVSKDSGNSENSVRTAVANLTSPARPARHYRLDPVAELETSPLRLVNCGISERSADSQPLQSTRNSPASFANFLDFIYDSAPVVGFRVLKNDVLTVREARYPDELAGRLEGAVRGKIEYLSHASRKRLALVAGNSPVVFRSFVTVSYPREFPCDGKLVKKHLHALLAALRRKCGALEYLWFLEFQRRGAPHLHLFLDHALPEPLAEMNRAAGRVRKVCRVNWQSQNWLSDRWFRIVNSGDPRHLRAGAAWEVIEKPDGAARYVAKESYKTFQKVVPPAFQNVGRFWGCSGNVSPDEGYIVRASKAEIAKVFPASIDPAGNPFPVMFSAAEEYRKIRDTAKDPAKFKAWKSGKSQTEIPLLVSGSPISSSFKPTANPRKKRR